MSCTAHDWDTNYICTACGAVKHLSAPQWAVVIPMPSGPRGVWLALLSFGDRRGPSAPIWPCNAEIQRRSGGITASTLGRHLAHLEELGWISRTGAGQARRIALAWLTPYADPRNIADPRDIATPAISGTDPRNIGGSTPAISGTDPRNIGYRTSQDQSGTSQDQSEKSARPRAAPAGPPPEVVERHAQIVAASKLAAEAQLELERQVERERSRRDAARDAIPADVRAAVVAAGVDWERELDCGDGRWRRDLARCVGAGLGPAEVTRVLAAWDAAASKLGAAGVLRLAAAPPRGSGPVAVASLLPQRRAVWWECWGPWVAEQLDPGGGERPKGDPGRGSTPLSCPAPASDDAMGQHDYLAVGRSIREAAATDVGAA